MPKATPDTTLDALLTKYATATRQSVCSDEPLTFAGIAAVQLASVAMTAGNGNGDYVIANGDVNGRKVTVGIQADIAISASGEADHIVLDDGVNIIAVTTCTAQVLTSGGTVTVPAWDAEVADPT